LVQVGDVYFVCDGHHRISVARAMGQQDIEAKVMVWQVTGPLPWETSVAATTSQTKRQRLGGSRTNVDTPILDVLSTFFQRSRVGG
jgi:hypothetical protein